MITESDLLLFNKDVKELNGIDLETKAIELVNYVEDNNLKIEDYRDLHFYASFTGLLNEENKLKEEYREISLLEEFEKYLTEGIYDNKFMVKPIKRNVAESKLTNSVYIILTHTGSIVGKAIEFVTGGEYNHASIALDSSFNNVYAFGRDGKGDMGFIREEFDKGLFLANKDKATFSQYELRVTLKEYNNIKKSISYFIKNKKKYEFDMKAMVLSGLNIAMNNDTHKFFCSKFIEFVLERAGIKLFDKNYGLVKPVDFSLHPDCKLVDKGMVWERVEEEKRGRKRAVNESTEILTEAPVQTKRKRITDLVLKIVGILDKSGVNYNKYYKMFSSMTDEQFAKYMDNFVNDKDENIYLEILPNKSEPSMDQIEEALKILNIPTEEYVYFRHDGYKDNPIRTREKVPTGYITIRRLQQILSKKNTYSLNIDSRNMKTGQVSGDDKIARISDSELYALTIFKADNAIKEFFGPRADNMKKKQDMYSKISKYGYVYLDELEGDATDSQTLNTINVFLLGAGIESDLITSKEKTAKETLRKIVVDDEIDKMKNESAKVTLPYNHVYIPLTEQDRKRGYIKYDPTEKFNGKYVNLTLEGLEQFIVQQSIVNEMPYYTKVDINGVDIAIFDEETNGAIIRLPINIPIKELRHLDIEIIEN